MRSKARCGHKDKSVIITWINSFWRITKPKSASEAGGDDSCIVENPCMLFLVTCITTHLRRHNDTGVTYSTQTINPNMYKRSPCLYIYIYIYYNRKYIRYIHFHMSKWWYRIYFWTAGIIPPNPEAIIRHAVIWWSNDFEWNKKEWEVMLLY